MPSDSSGEGDESCADEDDDDIDDLDIPREDLDLEVDIPTHHPCLSHTLQLIVKDGLNKADQINRVLAKISKLVNHVRHSTMASELFEQDIRLQKA